VYVAFKDGVFRKVNMSKNFWMVVQTLEEFEISRGIGFKIHGLKSKQRRRAQRMEPDDRLVYYVSNHHKWTATATVTSKFFEDHAPIWSDRKGKEVFPYRVNMEPTIILEEKDYIDARILAPRLEYVKRWAPERWSLAFFDNVHLLPQRDFRLIEGEMKRIPGSFSKTRSGKSANRSRVGSRNQRKLGFAYRGKSSVNTLSDDTNDTESQVD
jgi:predicted RNA-binding protein